MVIAAATPAATTGPRVEDHAGVGIGTVDGDRVRDFAGVRIGRVVDGGIVEDFAGVHIGRVAGTGAPRHRAPA